MFKELLLEKILLDYKNNTGVSGPIRILEMGSGTSSAIKYILDKNEVQIEYVGIEPSETVEIARKAIGGYKNVTLKKDFGYSADTQEAFDIVVSLSVLEHVKNLSKFIESSAKFVKKGGMVVHLYDLGHALYPSSLKEKFQIFLGNTFPSILPELKFVRYVPLPEVLELCTKNGLKTTNVSYHQMPSNKRYVNQVIKTMSMSESLAKTIFNFEIDIANHLENTREKEYIFPSVCVWAVKN